MGNHSINEFPLLFPHQHRICVGVIIHAWETWPQKRWEFIHEQCHQILSFIACLINAWELQQQKPQNCIKDVQKSVDYSSDLPSRRGESDRISFMINNVLNFH